ncbi:uncharacterized protein N7498_003939 [Penicillium cinerascens]|uniref:Fork-head domain-containing protein n=1 Tax=Penicillium cinerascens TaxID=70096 RepID=A0A9W9N336_9EURO|nr:uncharacterized protein N7498_003939 [Penicillium cinerascens]KAJ5212293.1 hypothetical protein N7498_003939 [Penicillium cinerascens]
MAQSNLRATKPHHGHDVLDWQCDPVTSSFYARDFYYRHPAQLETSEGNSLGNFLALRGTPPSPPISISSQQSSSISVNSMGHTDPNTLPDSNSPRTSLGDHNEGDYNTDLPYSKLIYRALKEADGHKLSLQQIYEWFTKNTNKGRDNTKGWQNSIRHNLSMNKGFTADKVEGSTGRKPQNLWALTQDAIDRGYVESTTRYRKTNGRKASPNIPVLRRQRSGSRGGKAAKNATKMRHPTQNERSERHYPFTYNQPQQPQHQPQRAVDGHYLPTPPLLVGVPHYQVQQVFNGLPMDTRDSSLQREYEYSDVIGCTSPLLGDNAVFCDVAEPEPNSSPTLDMGHMGCWYELRDPIMS